MVLEALVLEEDLGGQTLPILEWEEEEHRECYHNCSIKHLTETILRL